MPAITKIRLDETPWKIRTDLDTMLSTLVLTHDGLGEIEVYFTRDAGRTIADHIDFVLRNGPKPKLVK